MLNKNGWSRRILLREAVILNQAFNIVFNAEDGLKEAVILNQALIVINYTVLQFILHYGLWRSSLSWHTSL